MCKILNQLHDIVALFGVSSLNMWLTSLVPPCVLEFLWAVIITHYYDIMLLITKTLSTLFWLLIYNNITKKIVLFIIEQNGIILCMHDNVELDQYPCKSISDISVWTALIK